MANNVTLEIYSEAGDVQILGDGGIGFGLSATGNLTLVNDGQAHPQPMVVGTVTVNGSNPILAWKGVGAICLERITVSGSTFTFRLRAKSNTNIGLQYWVFDSAATATKDPTMAGIEAAFYDQFGVTTFDATMAAMRIMDAIETPRDSEVIPVGQFANLGGYTNVTVPSGKVYAVVQSTAGFVMTTYDTGAYSNSQTQPNQIEIGDGQEPGPGMRWRYQRLESYQSTGGYTSANNIRVGMTQFEQWEVGWQPASSEPHLNVYGQARHMIVDVTNFTSASAPNPTVVTGGVNATSRSVTTGGADPIAQSVTPSVTCSPSGGTAPYSYLWERISGDTTVVANGSATGASFSTSTASQPQSTTRSAVWRCRITDNNGIVGYAPEVTFTHVAQAYTAPDYVLDATNWANISQSVTGDAIATQNPYLTLSGITAPVTLRATISGLSGNLAAGSRLEMWVNGSMRYHSTNLGNGSWAGGTFNNGEQVCFVAYAVGAAGSQRSGSYTVTVQNITTGQTIDTFTVNQTVGVADTTPNTPAFGNITINSNDPDVGWIGTSSAITGINRPITLRIERYSYSGNLDAAFIDVIVKNASGAQVAATYFDVRGSAMAYYDVVVSNGYTVEYYAHGITNSGRKSATWNMVVWNLTENVQISSRTASVTVDADNNYNLPDYTVNTPSLPALTLYTNESSGWTNTAAWTVSGINRPITVRFTRGNQVDSGGSFTRRFFIYHSTNGGASWTEYFIGAGTQGVLDLVVNNGDLIHMRTYFDTSQGRGDSSFNAYITNLTTGAGIATLTVTGTTDADNNYNIGGAVNAVDWPNMSVFLNSTNGSSTMPNYTDGAARTISGLASGQTATISLSGSADGDAQGWVEVWKNGVNQGIKFLSAQNTNAVNTNYAAVSVVNGDTIHFRVGVNGPLATQFNTPVSVYKSLAVTVNASPGGAIDTFNASLTHSDSYSSGGGIGEPGGPIIRD